MAITPGNNYHGDLYEIIDLGTLTTELAKPGVNIVNLLSGALKSASEELDSRYKKNLPITDIVADRAKAVDKIIILAWNTQSWPDSSDINLIAVGGYGRGELLPHSDIDLLILTTKDNNKEYKNSISQFLTLLWDIGLQVPERSFRIAVRSGS